MTAEDAERLVIGPMTATFPAPTHLRGSREATGRALDVYRRALSGFSPRALEQGWQKVAQESTVWCWPKCGDVVAACRLFEPSKAPDDSWVGRVRGCADEYTRRFMRTSKHATRAREGGYEAELRRYVAAASWVIGQLIAGRDGISYESSVLFPWEPRDREAEDEFFQRAREQAQAGEIKVSIPPRLLKQWRQDHQEERSR